MDVIDSLPTRVVQSFAGLNNPFTVGELQRGETVLDIGSGAGFDSFETRGIVFSGLKPNG